MSSPTKTAAWQALANHSRQFKRQDFHLHDLFANSDSRFEEFSAQQGELLLDYSRHFLTDETRELLFDLAAAQDLQGAIEAMFKGEHINNTEDRAALHTALRAPTSASNYPEVAETLDRLEKFVHKIHSGDWQGFSGRAITDVVNIGIGGSDLGPALVVDALRGFSQGGIDLHFVSNVDPVHLQDTLQGLSPETTLFIIASKSFTTLETHQNAATARDWFLTAHSDQSAIAKHFVAISTNKAATEQFGIPPSNLFPMWDWVGGRYSLWSAIGLPIALAVGMTHFRQLLDGAHAMDEHFQSAYLPRNLPVIMGLLTVWYNAFFDCHSSAVVPYSQRLNLLPAYLQQLYMESLGKCVDKSGEPVGANTGEALWGTPGTNGQHSYFQLLHQGTRFIPVDFIAFAKPENKSGREQHQHLLANCFSQGMALMTGHIDSDAPHKTVPGNRPSSTLLLAELNPFNLGSLIALYEHKTYVQSVIWDINAFDQWGVELGKRLSRKTHMTLTESDDASLDDSTMNLIRYTKDWQA